MSDLDKTIKFILESCIVALKDHGRHVLADCLYGVLHAFETGRTQPEATKPAQDLGAAILEQAAQACDQQAYGTNGAYRTACLQCANAVRELRDAALASPADALVVGDRVDAKRTGTLYQAVQRAAGELPEGWTIFLEIERDAGTVELIDPEGERKLIDGNDGYLCQAVDAATDAAIQAQKDGHG